MVWWLREVEGEGGMRRNGGVEKGRFKRDDGKMKKRGGGGGMEK